MAAIVSGSLLHSLSSTYLRATSYSLCSLGFLQLRNYAARKGTREKARKKKVKVVLQKIEFIPHNMRELKGKGKDKKFLEKIIPDDSKKSDPIDNVWIERFHKWKIYPFEEAVQNHRETHHHTIYNLPEAPIQAHIELDLHGAKKTKVVGSFTQIVGMPHLFDHGERRKILAFCKSPEMQEVAKNAGAECAGGKDLIKQIQAGTFLVKDYDIIISEPTILPDLLLIRGLIRKKFPSTKLGTLSPDVNMLVQKFLTGIKYTAKPHPLLDTYGTIDVTFGTLNMDTKQLEENFAVIINDIHSVKPKREGPFITRVRLTSPPSSEMFKIEFEQYLPKTEAETEAETEEGKEEEETPDAVIASH